MISIIAGCYDSVSERGILVGLPLRYATMDSNMGLMRLDLSTLNCALTPCAISDPTPTSFATSHVNVFVVYPLVAC